MEWMTAGELADFYNNLFRKTTDSALKNVDASKPFGFFVSWGAYSLNDAAEMFILDPLRLGRGFGDASVSGNAWQTFGGILSDVGRATAFIPLGKLTKLAAFTRGGGAVARGPATAGTQAVATYGASVSSKVQSRVAAMGRSFINYVTDPAPGKGICAFVGVAQALRHRGSLFIPISRLAELVGVQAVGDYFEVLASKAPQYMVEIGGWLGKLNVPYKFVTEAKNVDDLLRLAENADVGGVYIFGVKWVHSAVPGQAAVNNVGHLMYVGQTAAGEWRIFDRTGHAVKSLKELAELFPGYAEAGLGKITYTFGNLEAPIFVPNAKLFQVTANGVQVAGVGAGVGAIIAIPIRIGSYLLGGDKR